MYPVKEQCNTPLRLKTQAYNARCVRHKVRVTVPEDGTNRQLSWVRMDKFIIGFPNVAAGYKAKRKNDTGRLQSGNYFIKLSRSPVKTNMKTGKRQFGNVGSRQAK